jgi:hypothetical protein
MTPKEKANELIYYSHCFWTFNKEDFNQKFNRLKGLHFVYILELNNNTIYVGHSKNIYSRIISHRMKYKFDKFFLIEYDDYNVLNCEREWIKLLQPLYNIRSKKQL